MTRTWLRIIVIPVLVACGGEKATEPGSQATPPASLRLVLPDTVTRGVAFPLTVTALDAQGQANASWSGSVSLTPSSGSVSPATVNVLNGSLTVQATIRDHAGDVSLTSSAGSATGTRSAFVLSGQPAARLEIHPQTFLLPTPGASQALTVRVLDADGMPTSASVAWQSTKAGVVSVSANGVATASGSGSSTITAQAGAVTSEPALAFVTTPAPGVVTVADEQMVGSMTPTNPQATYGPGWQYRVRLTGTPPQVGQLIASRGEKPLAGRVVGVQSAGAAGSDVTVELVPLDDVFPNLSISETIPLRSSATPAVQRRERAPWALAETEFNVGEFECEASLSQPNTNPFTLSAVTKSVSPTLLVDFDHTATRKRLVVRGGLTGALSANPKLTIGLNGSIECKAEVGEIPIPINGALAIYFGARVKLGVGFGMEGSATVATMGLDLSATGGITLTAGYDCNPGCTLPFSITGTMTGNAKPDLPSLSSDFRVTAGVSAFVWADLEFGVTNIVPGLDALDLEFLESKAGVKQEFNLSTADAQSADASYASNYLLKPFFSGGTQEDLTLLVNTVLTAIGVTVPPLTFEASGSALAESPAGTLQIIPPRVRAANPFGPGDTATFVVDLSRTMYLTNYAVESVQLFRKPSASSSLVPAPGTCASMVPNNSGQSLFTCKTDLPASMAGEQNFYAFVKPILGVALPVLLEVASDSKGTIIVDTTTVVYQTAFDGAIDSVWSHRTGETSPSGQRYLGKFANEPVKLSLSNLPAHGKVVVEMDLYIVDSWDGSNTSKPGNGPDIVTITVGGTTVLHSTFSNVNGVADHRQSYPDSYPGPLHDAATGAFSKNTLGYTGGSANHNEDSIYRFRFEVDHTASSIVIQVKGTNITPPPDEWWGIDNIRVIVR